MSKRISSIPTVPAQTPQYLRPILTTLREAVQVRFASSADNLDSVLSARELIQAGLIIDPNKAKNYTATLDGLFRAPPDEIDTWIDANVTTLDDAKDVLKQMAKTINKLSQLIR